MSYVDGYVLAVPLDKLEEYKTIARAAGALWKEFGALSYVECVGDDVPYGERTSFPRAVEAKEGEVIIFSWVVYASREDRDAANKKIMQDERMKKIVANMPFDGQRMIFGGFEPFVQL